VSAYAVRGVLVDTAFPQVRDEFTRWVKQNRPQGAYITHWHEDHAGNAMSLASLGIPLHMAAATEEWIRKRQPIGFYRRICWGRPLVLAAKTERFSHASLELIHAPGHTSDHHVVWDAERETLFGGDLFIGVKVRIAHHNEDLRLQVRVLRQIADLGPKRFFDAHRGPLADPVGELRAKADWMEETISAIEEHGRRGWSSVAIRDAVLGPEDLTGRISAGDYCRLNFVESVLDSTPAPARE